MFGLGIGELIVIGIVALLVLGPEKLPDAARSLGKALHQFRRAGQDLRDEVLYSPPPSVDKPVLTSLETSAAQTSVTAQSAQPVVPVESSLPMSLPTTTTTDKKE